MSAMCMCVRGRFVRAHGAEGHFRVCTQGHGVAECTKQGRAAVVVSVVLCAVHTAFVGTPPISSSSSLPRRLICQSLTTVASFPLSPLFFFPLYRISPPLFFPPSFLSSRSVAASFWLSVSLFFLSLLLLPAPLLQSVSPFSPSLSLSLPLFPSASFSSAASMFLCVNSWDAFVEGFHSDGPFEQVVIHVCWL